MRHNKEKKYTCLLMDGIDHPIKSICNDGVDIVANSKERAAELFAAECDELEPLKNGTDIKVIEQGGGIYFIKCFRIWKAHYPSSF